jgi:hypothetical protein
VIVLPATARALTLELNLLYVHGVKNCPASRQSAEDSLADLAGVVNAALPARIAAFEAAHPGITVVVHSAAANLYTATPSGVHPSDSPDPLNMDDWEVGDPGCSATQQGDPCTTAYEWRYRLAQEIDRLYPAPRATSSSSATAPARARRWKSRRTSGRAARSTPSTGASAPASPAS